MVHWKIVEAFAFIGIFVSMSGWSFRGDDDYLVATFLMSYAVYARVRINQAQGGE